MLLRSRNYNGRYYVPQLYLHSLNCQSDSQSKQHWKKEKWSIALTVETNDAPNNVILQNQVIN